MPRKAATTLVIFPQFKFEGKEIRDLQVSKMYDKSVTFEKSNISGTSSNVEYENLIPSAATSILVTGTSVPVNFSPRAYAVFPTTISAAVAVASAVISANVGHFFEGCPACINPNLPKLMAKSF